MPFYPADPHEQDLQTNVIDVDALAEHSDHRYHTIDPSSHAEEAGEEESSDHILNIDGLTGHIMVVGENRTSSHPDDNNGSVTVAGEGSHEGAVERAFGGGENKVSSKEITADNERMAVGSNGQMAVGSDNPVDDTEAKVQHVVPGHDVADDSTYYYDDVDNGGHVADNGGHVADNEGHVADNEGHVADSGSHVADSVEVGVGHADDEDGGGEDVSEVAVLEAAEDRADLHQALEDLEADQSHHEDNMAEASSGLEVIRYFISISKSALLHVTFYLQLITGL